MARLYPFTKIKFDWAHLPTIALCAGYVLFWIELFVIRLPRGHTTWLAWGCLVAAGVWALKDSKAYGLRAVAAIGACWRGQDFWVKVCIVAFAFLGFLYLAIALYASSFPPHLVQEFDAINYHIMLPRQHLLRHSFEHLSWSVFDLLLLPLDYALSPFILPTDLPNKCIFFVMFGCVITVVFKLVLKLTQGNWKRALLACAAVMGSHFVMIQVGTAMLDIVMLYCFLACVDSLFEGQLALAAVEGAFFAWSKAFIPFQIIFILGVVLGMIWLLRKKYQVMEAPVLSTEQWKIFLIGWVLASLVIAGPFLIKSFYYSGTPVYPFGVGILSPIKKYADTALNSIKLRAQDCLTVKDDYGHGRSWGNFVKHFWLIAVPEKGVNNAFDYPAGLTYLLLLLPFIAGLARNVFRKKLPVLSVIVILLWLTWWFGSQQLRFLTIALVMMEIISIAFLPRVSKILVYLLILCLGLELTSMGRAHKMDWGRLPQDVIRQQDRELSANQDCVNGPIRMSVADVAFAACPVDVSASNSVYVFP